MYTLKRTLANGIKYAALLLGAFVALLPIVVILFASLKTKAEYATTSPLTPR